MKVGLCLTFRKGINYGMQLQALATQKMLDKMGYETEIIDYNRTNYKHIRITPFLLISLINKRIKSIKNDKNNKEFAYINERKIKATNFVKEYFHNIVRCDGIDELERIVLSYDAIIVGSDQLWGPDAVFGNFFTLRFVPDNINKISYATSMGVSRYPYYARGSAKQFLKRINYISVREQQACDYLEKLIRCPIKVVLDPTYMLTETEWLDIIPYRNNTFGEYILCYFLGNKLKHKELAREFSDKTGLKIVSILSTESESSIDKTYADIVTDTAGPDEFINLIRNARYILTDSFHGIAFSVINKKQFFAFYRTNSEDKDSRNSRIDNILNLWNLERRLITDDAEMEAFLVPDIEYNKLIKTINKKREESFDFLKKALSNVTSSCNG